MKFAYLSGCRELDLTVEIFGLERSWEHSDVAQKCGPTPESVPLANLPANGGSVTKC